MSRAKPPDSPPALPAGADTAGEIPFGTWLRRQREARGVGLREIAESTRISMRYLEALEQGRFEVLPAPVFARGFLREYARVVGLDPDEVVNAFLAVAPPPAEAREQELTPAVRRAASPWGYGLLLTAAMVLLLAVAVALSFWAERRTAAPAETVAAEVPPALPEVLATPRPAEDDLPAGPSPVPVAIGAATPDAGAGDHLPGEEGAPASSPRTAPLVVELRFRDDCWVEARVDGRRRSGELRVGGETLVLEAEESVELTLGSRTAVAVTANGRPVPLPTSGSSVVRGLRLERSAFVAAVPGNPR